MAEGLRVASELKERGPPAQKAAPISLVSRASAGFRHRLVSAARLLLENDKVKDLA